MPSLTSFPLPRLHPPSPEVYLTGSERGPANYGEKADVFSFAILFYALLTGSHHPYQATFLTPEQVAAAVAEKDLRPPITLALKRKPELVHIIERAWSPAPADRPGMEEIAILILNARRAEEEAEGKRETEVRSLSSWFTKFSPL